MNDNPDLYTTHQAAEILGVTPITVIRWIEKGALTCLKTLGGHRRIQREELERLAREHNTPLRFP